MKTRSRIQYTIRSVPPSVDQILRRRARREDKSLNEVAVEALLASAGLDAETPHSQDLDEFIGSWEEDSGFDKALAEQDKVDRRKWR